VVHRPGSAEFLRRRTLQHLNVQPALDKSRTTVAEAVVAAIRSAWPAGVERAALHEPWFAGNEWEYVKDCLDSGWVSSAGRYVDDFERGLADFTGAKYAIATVNGTAALHVCLQLAGVDRDDEVLLPALTFIATANAVSYCGAVPHFVDSDSVALGVDPERLREHLSTIVERRSGAVVNRRTGRRLAAVVVMHAFGHPANTVALAEVCREFALPLIEDAAESLGSYIGERHTGNAGILAALSFNGNKVVTTGGGGAVLTSDERLARAAKHITTTARVPHAWAFLHDQVGYNYRLPNINAALGCAQLERLTGFLTLKRALSDRYRLAFEPLSEVEFVREPAGTRSNYWLNNILLSNAEQRDEVLRLTNEQGIMTRPLWTLMHRLPMYAQCPRADLSTAEALEQRLVSIPSSAFLGAARA